MRKKYTTPEWDYQQLIYAWMACCNLEAELAHDPESVAHFRRRQRELERDLARFLIL
jgi:hypothetical protein